MLSPGTKSMFQKLMVLDVAELTRAVGKERRRAAGARSRRLQTDVSAGRKAGRRCGVSRRFWRSWCGAAVRFYKTFSDPSCFFFFFDGCSCVGRWLSPRYMANIREMNESVFSLSFLETGGIGLSESREKVECSILTWHHQHFVSSTLCSLTSDHQVLLSQARQLFVDCSRVVPSEVIR